MPLAFANLRASAKNNLKQARNPGYVVLLHTGVILLVSMLLTVADYFLNRQISTTGGLSGLGARSVLATIQSLLRLTQAVMLPFWQIGYVYYTVQVVRGQSTGIPDLLEGFRRFFHVLRLKALMAGIAMALIFVSAYLSSFLFLLTPWAMPLMQKMESLAESTMDPNVLLESISAMTAEVMIPILVIFLLCFLTGSILVFFRLRMAELWLMDHPNSGALEALRNSRQMLRGNCKALLRIDLSFWWFYLLEALLTIICYGDVILGVMGIEMTVDAFGSFFLFFGIYLSLQLALYWWKRNEVSVTYAQAYLELLPSELPTETE